MDIMKIRNEDIFQSLSNTEIESALHFAISNSISFVGKLDDDTVVVVKPQQEGSSFTEVYGFLKSSSRIKHPQNAVFSFVANETKYLFKGTFKILHGKSISIGPVSRFYCIQRRSNERLKIPDDYYALFKFTHINTRPFRSFGKVKNISAGGIAICFRSDDPKFNGDETIRGVLTLSCRPPEDIEIKLKHVIQDKEGDLKLQIIGGSFLPENSALLVRRMTSVITDIYRDIFKKLDDKKS